jgi:hypothetical protein
VSQGEITKLQQNIDAIIAMLSAISAQIDRQDARIGNLERRGTRMSHVCYQPLEGEPTALCAK